MEHVVSDKAIKAILHGEVCHGEGICCLQGTTYQICYHTLEFPPGLLSILPPPTPHPGPDLHSSHLLILVPLSLSHHYRQKAYENKI